MQELIPEAAWAVSVYLVSAQGVVSLICYPHKSTSGNRTGLAEKQFIYALVKGFLLLLSINLEFYYHTQYGISAAIPYLPNAEEAKQL